MHVHAYVFLCVYAHAHASIASFISLRPCLKVTLVVYKFRSIRTPDKETQTCLSIHSCTQAQRYIHVYAHMRIWQCLPALLGLRFFVESVCVRCYMQVHAIHYTTHTCICSDSCVNIALRVYFVCPDVCKCMDACSPQCRTHGHDSESPSPQKPNMETRAQSRCREHPREHIETRKARCGREPFKKKY